MHSPQPLAGRPTRYSLGGAGPTYTVEGLETLALRGLLTPDTEIAREGDPTCRPLRHWDFAEQVFPVKQPLLLKPTASLPLVPVRAELALATPEANGRHITTLDEIRVLLDRDPNDPQAIVLLNQMRDDMRRLGVTAPEAFENFFLSNRALNHRLTLKAVCNQVSHAVRTHRATALLGIITLDAFFGVTILFGTADERGLAIIAATLTNLTLGLIGFYAHHLERWLNLNPAKAALSLIALIYVSFNAVIAAILCGPAFLIEHEFYTLWFFLMFHAN
jgi:hypothetical protein